MSYSGVVVVKITFDNKANLPVDLIIQVSEFNSKSIEALSDKISNIVISANHGESIDDFVIPKDWITYKYVEKLTYVANYLSDKDGTFKVVPYISMTKNV